MKRKAVGWLALAVFAGVFYTALALLYLRPVWQVWKDRIAPNTDDPRGRQPGTRSSSSCSTCST